MGAITDNGVGNYTLAFDTAFNDTNYWCAGWGRNGDGSHNATILCGASGHTKTASAFQVQTDNEGGSAGSLQDSSEMHITLWGDYA